MSTEAERELEDELAVNRVILSSLDGETFDGVEAERREAREQILRLQQQLRDLRANTGTVSAQEHRNGESSTTGSGSQPCSPHVAAYSQGEHRPSTPTTPTWPQASQIMAQPGSGSDIWGLPGSGSLASRTRKRHYNTATLGVDDQHQSKSRRTTPTRASPAGGSPFASQGSEVIDLTGIDDADDARSYVNRVKLEEERRAQERRDHEYAMSLSREATSPSISTSSSSRAPVRNAFGHLMATQRANACAPSHQEVDERASSHSSSFATASYPSLPPAASASLDNAHPRLPGTYDPSWDEVTILDSTNPGTARPSAVAVNSPLSSNHHHSSPLVIAHGPEGPTRVLPDGHTGGSGGPYNQFMYPWMAPVVPNRILQFNGQQSPNSSQGSTAATSPVHLSNMSVERASDRRSGQPRPSRADMPSWSDFRAIATGTWNGTLSNIINRTSAYDFANRTDAYGNPLSQQLASYLDDTDPYGDPAMSQKELDELLQNIEPDIQVPKGLQGITPDALTTPLYKHQEVALTWMKKMEDGTNKGGILADDMGLGKTISTLALIHERKSTNRPKTNLIIAPVALMRQWEEEISRKTKSTHKLSVFTYHGKKSTPDELMKFDVVLTTYGTLAAELKRLEKWHEERENRDKDFNDRDLAVKCPMLHPTKAKFHRVILDEAQCIKNKETQTAKACHQLRSQYRWCLTGTPMMNGVVELFSLLKFLQIKPYNSWNSFRQTFGVLFGKRGDSKSNAMRRLRVLLKAILLRRKKNSLIDGKPIVELPKKTEEVSYAELNTDERDFYAQLESKSQVIFNKYLREGSVGKNYANVLVLLLRLRQACCHPHLNLDVDDLAPAVDDAMLERVRRLGASTVNRIKQIEAFECPVCYDVMTSPSFFFPCGHDCCRPCLTQLVDTAAQNNIQAGNESSKAQCITCRSDFDPKECFTYEAFQQIHMPEEYAKRQAEAEAAEGAGCEDCETESDSDADAESEATNSEEVDAKGNLRGFIEYSDDELDEHAPSTSLTSNFPMQAGRAHASAEVKAEAKLKVEDQVKNDMKSEGEASNSMDSIPKQEPTTGLDDEEAADSNVPNRTGDSAVKKKKKKRVGKGKGKAKTSDIKPSMLKSLRKESFKNREAYKKYMAYLRQTWLPSAKVDECIRLLREFQQTGQKTIIFSQWTLLLDLIEVAMGHEFNKKPLRYDGSMSATERAIAAQDFRDKRDCKVLLVSLRAGNAGLNLTAASRVIIMDPFWNPYIEMQAVDRAYRIGQKNEVKVYRILTQQTVEDRIVELQAKKKEMVEAALDENAGKQLGRLSVAELRYLFTGNR